MRTKRKYVSDIEIDTSAYDVSMWFRNYYNVQSLNTTQTIYFSEFILFQIISPFRLTDSLNSLIYVVKAKWKC